MNGMLNSRAELLIGRITGQAGTGSNLSGCRVRHAPASSLDPGGVESRRRRGKRSLVDFSWNAQRLHARQRRGFPQFLGRFLSCHVFSPSNCFCERSDLYRQFRDRMFSRTKRRLIPFEMREPAKRAPSAHQGKLEIALNQSTLFEKFNADNKWGLITPG